jgi:hypothetical protein
MPSKQKESGSLNQRRSLRSSETSPLQVTGLVSLGSFGAHKNGVAAKAVPA